MTRVRYMRSVVRYVGASGFRIQRILESAIGTLSRVEIFSNFESCYQLMNGEGVVEYIISIMETVVFIAKERGEKVVELEVENDGSLLYSALVKFFPDVRGLFYFSKEGAVCGVQFTNGKFYPPQTECGRTMFYCTFLQGTGKENAVLYAAEKEGSPIAELPLEEDGSLLYTTLVKFFPKARGLTYYSAAGAINGVRLISGRFFPRPEDCVCTVFYCVFFEESIDEPFNLDGGRSCTMSYYCIESNTEPAADDLKNQVLFENYSQLPNFQTSPKKEIRDESLKINAVMNKKHKRNVVTPVIKMAGPFKCNECGAHFLKAQYLRRHERFHTGEKPFSCLICNERFPRKDYLKKHIRVCYVNAKLTHENLGPSS